MAAAGCACTIMEVQCLLAGISVFDLKVVIDLRTDDDA